MTETELDPQETKQLRGQLQERLSILIEEFRRELETQEEQGYAELSDQVRDLGDDAAADVLVDSRLFDIQRDAEELREIREALVRMDDNSYGVCIDCGEPIAAARLRAQPIAARCIACQERYEREYKAGPNPREI